MALIVPSSFYRIDAGQHALNFSPGFNILIQSLTLYTQNNCSILCWWKTVEVYKIANMYIEYVVYSPFLALSV